tara:strand:- start:331 stop:657 length:327 start_codon:yes stop_codon:yes gene_type:complete
MIKKIDKKYNFIMGYFFTLITFNSSHFVAIEINNLELLAQPCFFASRFEECKRSLIKLEDLQNKAALREDYACQTRLLGLQTDLMLIMNHQKRKASPITMIKEVKSFC